MDHRITAEEGRNISRVIASTYEVMERIGSGGTGVVYLARHLRLDKLVVLKADKRTLTTEPEKLRREVDALKNLSHTYIPQVYDFIEEDGVVYTVMDYIEGESLDKPLERGEKFPQPTVIRWAGQLLEALCYLHSRPPHGILHSDIKPANVMRTPQGDIRLIDFNIALALGEEGAVQLSGSRGYASPEHYGVELSRPQAEKTGRTGGNKGVRLDVRSDIYSLGATLYHLLTGRRPDSNAGKVLPIGQEEASAPVAAMIRKAMDPDPALRYQTAEEMLAAVRELRAQDPRVVRRRRCGAAAAAVFAVMFLAGGVCAFTGQRMMNREQELENAALQEKEAEEREKRLEAQSREEEQRKAKEALASINDSQAALEAGNARGAAELALAALELDTPYHAQAQKALTDALGVYDLTAGFKAHQSAVLPSQPQKLCLSPLGTRAAVMAGEALLVYDTGSGDLLIKLPKGPSALSDVLFLDENRVVFAGDGALRAYDLETHDQLWAGEDATALSLSADGSTLAAVYRDNSYAVLYDAQTGKVKGEVSFQGKRQKTAVNELFTDLEHSLFSLNGDGSLLAVSFDAGALWVYDLRDQERSAEIFDASDYTRFEGGFHRQFFAFSATTPDGGDSTFAVIDMEQLAQTVCHENSVPFHVQADESGLYVSTGHTLVGLDTETWADFEVAYSNGASIASFVKTEGYTLAVLQDGTCGVYDNNAVLMQTLQFAQPVSMVRTAGGWAAAACADSLDLRVLKLEDHREARVFSYDGSVDHMEARLSAERDTVMLFRHDGFRLFSLDGEEFCRVEFPEGGIYDTQYRRDELGSYLEVTYDNGLVRSYSASDGALLSERLDEIPDLSKGEEFLTEKYRIVSPLHGTPQVYDRDGGGLICELEPDAYLTYVTEAGGHIVTEYITARGERYGLLLDQDCETVARLPELCDVLEDGTLLFDDMHGTLRQSCIYTVEELIELAKKQEEVL